MSGQNQTQGQMSQTKKSQTKKIVISLLKVSENPCWDGIGGILSWPYYADELEAAIEGYVRRLILLNAPVVGYGMFMKANRINDWEIVKTIVRIAREKNLPILSYIGHSSTALLLSEMLEMQVATNRGIYVPESYDLALIFRLRGRPSGEVTNLRPEDIEILYIHYL